MWIRVKKSNVSEIVKKSNVSEMLATPPAPRCVYVFSRKKHWLDETKGENVKEKATAGYFYDTFAYEICFYGIYFYWIFFYGIFFYGIYF
jgi:hypothetical protein